MNMFRVLPLAALFFMTLVSPSSAQVDRCDDYLLRHNRRDLTPQSITIGSGSGTVLGQQRVTVKVKHVGDVDLTGGPRSITIAVNGHEATTTTPVTIRVGESVNLSVTYPGRLFPFVGTFKVAIDTTRTAGQWGCSVFSNDTKDLSSGVIIKPFPRPFPRPDIIPPNPNLEVIK